MFGRDEKVSSGPPDGGAVHHTRHFSGSRLWTVAIAGDAERFLFARRRKKIESGTCRFLRLAEKF